MIKAVLFDTIGTTVKTDKPEFIIAAFQKSFADHNIQVDESFLVQQRGKNKSHVIRQVLTEQNINTSFEEKILESFNEHFSLALNSFTETEGLEEVFSFLRSRHIYIGIGTGLSVSVFNQLQQHLDWQRHNLDYIGISEIIGKSRPDPAMIFDMMKQLKIDSPHDVLKVGDTVADIQEGKNAGVYTAVVLAGTQPDSLLLNESPDFVLKDLRDIIQLPIFI
jgi:HAD superfamily hydrolase (TIGR01549 family)